MELGFLFVSLLKCADIKPANQPDGVAASCGNRSMDLMQKYVIFRHQKVTQVLFKKK